MKNDKSWCRMPYAVMKDERLTGLSAFVYAVMLDRAKGDEVTVTAKKLAELLEKPQRNIERAIKQLKDTGYITGTTRGKNGSTVYSLKQILPDKRQKPERDEQEQLAFDLPDSSGTFETDLTPEQVRHLSELLATKLSSDGRTPDRIDKLLRGEYAKMKVRAKKDVKDVAAYLAKMIENWEPEPDSDGYDDDFDVEAYKRVCINSYETV